MEINSLVKVYFIALLRCMRRESKIESKTKDGIFQKEFLSLSLSLCMFLSRQNIIALKSTETG